MTLALLPAFAFLLALLVAATRVLRTPATLAAAEKPVFRFVVPAHDEEAAIEATVRSLLAQDYPRDRFEVVVVADNCSDGTAARAAAAGAKVLERRDTGKRGKGYALEYAVGRILGGEPAVDAVVIVDADTRADADLLGVFAAALSNGVDFAQGYYSASNPDASWRTQLLTLALALFNGVWLAGEDGLGIGASLRGNGMLFSRKGLARQPLVAYGLAEDLEFAWRLRVAGERIAFLSRARVYGEMVSAGGSAAKSQRLRWEHGRKAVAREFRKAVLATRWPWPRKAAALVDLHFVPLSRLGAALALALLAALIAGAPLLVDLCLLYALVLAAYVASPVALLGLPGRYLLAAAHLPRYVVWKAALLFSKKPGSWVRTPREPQG